MAATTNARAHTQTSELKERKDELFKLDTAEAGEFTTANTECFFVFSSVIVTLKY